MVRMVELQREIRLLKKEINGALNNVIERAQFIEGPAVKELEENIKVFLGVKHAITLRSGSDALFLALKAANLDRNSEVITTALSFIATAEAIIHAGVKPVFADIDYNTMNIDPRSIEKNINNKTKALIVVHIFGNPCKIDEISEIARKYHLFLIEDCAQSFGSTFNNQFVGTFGDCGCFSFFPTKNLGCYGDGGLVITNNDALAEHIKILKNHGSIKKYEHIKIGFNSRLDSIQAAILNIKLQYVNTWNKIRQMIANKYIERFPPNIGFQHIYKGAEHIYHQFTIKYNKRLPLMNHLNAQNIESAIYYPIPIHKQKAFQDLRINAFLPKTEKLAQEVLSIPIHPYLKDWEIEHIIKSINSFKG